SDVVSEEEKPSGPAPFAGYVVDDARSPQQDGRSLLGPSDPQVRGNEDAGAGEGTGQATTVESPVSQTISETSTPAVRTELDRADIGEPSWDEVQFSLLAEDDLSGAYWVARSLEESRLRGPMASDILATVQGSRWLSYQNDGLAAEIVDL